MELLNPKPYQGGGGLLPPQPDHHGLPVPSKRGSSGSALGATIGSHSDGGASACTWVERVFYTHFF